jgi:general secretion pathway protein K
VASRFFEVRGRLRLDQMVLEERSVLQRDGLDVKVLWRERGVVDPAALAAARSRAAPALKAGPRPSLQSPSP